MFSSVLMLSLALRTLKSPLNGKKKSTPLIFWTDKDLTLVIVVGTDLVSIIC